MSRELPFEQATPRDISERLTRGDDLALIDVREPYELALAAIDGAESYPMSRAWEWIDALPRDRALVIVCHHGVRSAQVAYALTQRGYTNVINLAGGIDRWTDEVDPAVPKY
jgi:rhodanese-related sulfurtransferase